ncbi:unnamed protein product [Arctogadus glacialis]
MGDMLAPREPHQHHPGAPHHPTPGPQLEIWDRKWWKTHPSLRSARKTSPGAPRAADNTMKTRRRTSSFRPETRGPESESRTLFVLTAVDCFLYI